MFVWKEGIPVPNKIGNSVSALLISANQNDFEEKRLRRFLNDKYSECYDSLKMIGRAFDTLFECRHIIHLFCKSIVS